VRAVVQRVSRACVRVGERVTGAIDAGFLVLASVGLDDDERDARALAEKIVGLRVLPDERGLMNRSLLDTGGSVLLVSQFTLHGDARRGRRPSFVAAARDEQARALYECCGGAIASAGVSVAYGEFGAQMDVELVNAGPVTILLDTKRAF